MDPAQPPSMFAHLALRFVVEPQADRMAALAHPPADVAGRSLKDGAVVIPRARVAAEAIDVLVQDAPTSWAIGGSRHVIIRATSGPR